MFKVKEALRESSETVKVEVKSATPEPPVQKQSSSEGDSDPDLRQLSKSNNSARKYKKTLRLSSHEIVSTTLN